MVRRALALSLLLAGCLPDDTRPAPGRLNVSVDGDVALGAGVTTADGWTISFDRFLISLGEVELEGDDCTSYNETDYLRILDLRAGAPQKLSTPYARGSCELTFRVASPREDVALGTGVTAADVILFRTAASDAFEQNAGLTLLVAASAEKAGAVERFEWGFRRGIQYEDCRLGDAAGVQLESRDDESVNLRIESATLMYAGSAERCGA